MRTELRAEPIFSPGKNARVVTRSHPVVELAAYEDTLPQVCPGGDLLNDE